MEVNILTRDVRDELPVLVRLAVENQAGFFGMAPSPESLATEE